MIYIYGEHHSYNQLVNVLNNIKRINWFIIDLLLLERDDSTISSKL